MNTERGDFDLSPHYADDRPVKMDDLVWYEYADALVTSTNEMPARSGACRVRIRLLDDPDRREMVVPVSALVPFPDRVVISPLRDY